MKCIYGCGSMTAKGKVGVAIVIERGELLYKIKNAGYIEGHVLDEKAPECVRHMVTDIGGAGNVDRVNSVLDRVFAEVTEMLYPYTSEEIAEGDVMLNRDGEQCMAPAEGVCVPWEREEDEAYVIEMHVPDTFSRGTLRLLGRMVEEYMVCRALEDWLSMTNVASAGVWKQKGDDAALEIDRIKNMRRGPLRRSMSPF